MSQYAFGVELSGTLDTVRERLNVALAAERLGVVSEVDVQAVMRNKLGLEVPGYRILGACAPGLAKRVIDAEPEAGALLPCNVVLRELDGGRVAVDFMDPEPVLGLSTASEVRQVAAEAQAMLHRVVEALRAG